MGTKSQERQRFIRYYKDQTGKTEVNMRDVAKFAVSKGWKLPIPPDPLDMLAQEFTQSAREEIRKDPVTKRPYRANHAISVTQGQEQMHLWIDIDEATRAQMLMSLVKRRDQMIGDGLQLTLDEDHWNRINPNEEPIRLPMDFGPDIEWRLNAPDEGEQAS